MDDSRLCESVKQNLEAQGIRLTGTQAQKLYASVLAGISEILDRGDIVRIPDFGIFWKKDGGDSSTLFFKPEESILERINEER